jgi:hypothetical protein
MASKFALVFIAALALAGCAHQQQYVRTDGAPVDITQLRSASAQCRGKAVVAINVPPAQVFNACMARNGYIK